jgi:hypothetical protein
MRPFPLDQGLTYPWLALIDREEGRSARQDQLSPGAPSRRPAGPVGQRQGRRTASAGQGRLSPGHPQPAGAISPLFRQAGFCDRPPGKGKVRGKVTRPRWSFSAPRSLPPRHPPGPGSPGPPFHLWNAPASVLPRLRATNTCPSSRPKTQTRRLGPMPSWVLCPARIIFNFLKVLHGMTLSNEAT